MTAQMEHVTKSYRRGKRVLEVVKDMSFSVEEQSFFMLSGRSGSGKSTLLALLGGYLKPDKGSVFFHEQALSEFGEEEIASLHSERIGYLPQTNVLLSEFTILENVLLPFLLFERKKKKEEALELLKRFQIGDLADRYPYELSGGELRRASIARLLLREPELYLLDEPSGGLDKEMTKTVMECMLERREKGATVVVATHDDLVLQYGSRVYELDEAM